MSSRPNLQAEQDFGLVGEITDDTAKGGRQLLYECRRREDLLILGALRILKDIDDLQLVSAVELLGADTVEVVDSDCGARTGARDVERQDEFRQLSSTSLKGAAIMAKRNLRCGSGGPTGCNGRARISPRRGVFTVRKITR